LRTVRLESDPADGDELDAVTRERLEQLARMDMSPSLTDPP
jgi:hypothetical protein